MTYRKQARGIVERGAEVQGRGRRCTSLGRHRALAATIGHHRGRLQLVAVAVKPVVTEAVSLISTARTSMG